MRHRLLKSPEGDRQKHAPAVVFPLIAHGKP